MDRIAKAGIVSKHYLVDGKVQGVGYRNFVRRQAIGLGIAGWVRNLMDGRVEVLAIAPVDKLVLLKNFLLQGPDRAEVISITENLAGEKAKPFETQKFEVLEDGGAPWEF